MIVFVAASLAFGEQSPTSSQADTSPEGVARITGRVMIKTNSPMVNGVVLLFDKETGPPPHPYKYWRIPDLISGTDTSGRFTLDVAEGTYYLMVAQKRPDGEIGPPNEKEFLYFHGDADGNPYPLKVSVGSKLNLGVLTKSFVWTPNKVPHSKDITAIEGNVADQENRPVARAVVFAYLSKNTVGRPAFVSDRTDKLGRFQLRVYEGGTYYLKVRGVIGGGAPETGEYTNVTKESDPAMVTVTKGNVIKGVSLKVEKFSGKGSTGVAKPAKIWKNTEQLQGI